MASGVGAWLRRLGRAWRLGMHLDHGWPVKLAVVIAGLSFVLTYGAGALARNYAPHTGPSSAWLAFQLFEHRRAFFSAEVILLLILTAVPVLGLIPLATAQMRWWTRRRWVVLIAIALVAGAAASNLVEFVQKGSVTDFLLVRDVGDFSAGDIAMIVGCAGSIVLWLAPDPVAVSKRHIGIALVAAGISLAALPFVRAPLNHLPFLALLLASISWLVGYFVWRMRIGGPLLATLTRDVNVDAGLETDLFLRDLETALSNNLHGDLAASRGALAKLANAYTKLGRRDDLRRIADAYLAVAEDVDNDRMKAWALHHMGSAWVLGGDLGEADRVWRQALRLAEQQSDDPHRVRLLGDIAWIEAEMAKPGDSRATYLSAIDLADRLGDAEMASRLRHDVGAPS